MVGAGHRRPGGRGRAAATPARCDGRGARQGGRACPPPDGSQLGRGALRAVLRARVGQGPAGGRRSRAAWSGTAPSAACPSTAAARSSSPPRPRRSAALADARAARRGQRRARSSASGRGRLHELEPHVRGDAALFVPGTAITDYGAVARALADDLVRRAAASCAPAGGGSCDAGATEDGPCELGLGERSVRTRWFVNCAGLHSDRVARLAGAVGADGDVSIVPFRGEYHELAPGARGLVRQPRVPGARSPLAVPGGAHDPDGRRVGARGPQRGARPGARGVPRRCGSAADLRRAGGRAGAVAARRLATGAPAREELARSRSERLLLRDVQRLLPEVGSRTTWSAPAPASGPRRSPRTGRCSTTSPSHDHPGACTWSTRRHRRPPRRSRSPSVVADQLDGLIDRDGLTDAERRTTGGGSSARAHCVTGGSRVRHLFPDRSGCGLRPQWRPWRSGPARRCGRAAGRSAARRPWRRRGPRTCWC